MATNGDELRQVISHMQALLLEKLESNRRETSQHIELLRSQNEGQLNLLDARLSVVESEVQNQEKRVKSAHQRVDKLDIKWAKLTGFVVGISATAGSIAGALTRVIGG